MSDNWSDRPPWSSPGGTPPDPPSDPWGGRPVGGSMPPAPPPPGGPWSAPRPPAGFPSGPPLGPPPGPSPAPPAGSGRGLKAALAVLSAACLLFAGLTVGLLIDRQPQALGTFSAPVTPGTLPDDPAAAVAAALAPSVVQLDTEDGLGSGVVYDPSGLVLTNAHVVGTTRDLDVRFNDGRTVAGQLLGSDPETDVAVVKIDATGVTAARLDDDKLVVGQTAIAIGSPFGLDQSVTAGIISAVDRPVSGSNDTITINMIQTDAPINPGNSGGALANRMGEVVGINTLIFSQTGENSGIGFAIPIQTAKTVADKIVRGEPLEHGWLGVSSSPTDDGSGGAQLSDISADSPAEQAGLRVGDIVVGLDDTSVKGPSQLSALVVARSPGERVRLKIRRDGGESTVDVTLGKRPTAPATRRRSRPSTTR